VVQLQFQKEVEEKLHGCLTTLLETLTALSEVKPPLAPALSYLYAFGVKKD
jgi:hypothetical protein